MLIHSAYFWFWPDADTALVQRFHEGLARLTAIPDVQAAHFGRPATTPKRSVIDDSYAWALIETFADAEAHDRYQDHPIHQAFVDESARAGSGSWSTTCTCERCCPGKSIQEGAPAPFTIFTEG